MPTKSNLPAEVHDHFRKANLLHGYVEKSLGEARQHALETGQELLAAKQVIPHGSWEDECARLFDGSPRAARFYMTFARDFGKLKSATKIAILMLEGTLVGAAKAARDAAAKPKPSTKPKPPEPHTASGEPIDVDSEPVDETPEDLGKCPNCLGAKWDKEDDGVSCAKCHHPHGEPAGDVDDDRINTQRQKAVKTVEALMRSIDDLQAMKARPEHEEAIRLCKQLLAIAKAWTD